MDPFQKRIYEANQQHSSKLDDNLIELSFHSFSHSVLEGEESSLEQGTEEGGAVGNSDERRDITQDNSFLALQEVLRKWDLMTTEQEDRSLKQALNEVWTTMKNEKTGNISAS